MSAEQNAAVVQKAYADFSRGDIASVLSACDENIEWITPGPEPLGGSRKGRSQAAEFFRLVNEAWEFLSFEPREYIASGDRVVALGHYHARSRETGREAASDWAMVWTLRDGKATRFQEYTDTAALLSALPAAEGASAE